MCHPAHKSALIKSDCQWALGVDEGNAVTFEDEHKVQVFGEGCVWFVEKDQQQASKLYSLVEFKGVRNDASFEKDYILGRYGAIPFLGNLRDVLSPPDNDKPQVEGVSISAKGEQGDHAET